MCMVDSQVLQNILFETTKIRTNGSGGTARFLIVP